jgi:hypothetical protein
MEKTKKKQQNGRETSGIRHEEIKGLVTECHRRKERELTEKSMINTWNLDNDEALAYFFFKQISLFRM